MLFNTLNFAIFLPIVFLLYWSVGEKNIRIQNIILIVASYFFYASWDLRFLSLLLFSTLLDFVLAIMIEKGSRPKLLLWISISINLGLLAVFKYFDFFSISASAFLASMGFHSDPIILNLVLPVGISFYTFHGLSYIIDVYKKRIHPERNFIDYSLFVCFFPLLVAGPIERATHLLPQLKGKRAFSYTIAVDGLRQILWGLFKKVVIADSCAVFANDIFNNSSQYFGATAMLGAFFFAFQIYGDFSGYSDIALGTAKLFNIRLLRNFSYPYFSRNIAEFWRRWHISLSSWFRDYVYIPLGGSKGSLKSNIRNIFIIFLLSGLWHGANWTFIIWGGLNALYFLPSFVLKSNRKYLSAPSRERRLPSFHDFTKMLFTFFLTVIAWVFFRSDSAQAAFRFLGSLFVHPGSYLLLSIYIKYSWLLILIALFVVVEWIGREKEYPLADLMPSLNPLFRRAVYFILIFSIFWYNGVQQQFIYFQF